LSTEPADITLKLRAAGVIIRHGKVLLHRGETDDFWTLPGGTIEAGERSDDALCREIDEEMQVKARAVRLLWIVENRFTYLSRRYHEIGFYWLLPIAEHDWRSFPDRSGEFELAEQHIIFCWAALSDIAGMNIKPDFLKSGLVALPATTVHLQVDE
jgi:ADP-ribose pyrophosphatase YjhB (NUDIX family)